MLHTKLVILAILSFVLLTAGVSHMRPVIAIDKQSLKEQLLDRILSQEEDDANETSATLNNAESVKNNVENIEDKILEEAGLTLSKDEAKQVNQDDNKILSVHASKQGNNCRSGDVLAGASNKKDLKILSNCEEVIGTVKHTKKMNDGDYKFALKVRDQYKDLLNKINNKKTGGYLIVEIVPKDQKNNKDVVKPKTGDKVDVWGAWVTDKPKGWHEIHPAWKVVKVK
jgi:protein-tyrosine-phosphatase